MRPIATTVILLVAASTALVGPAANANPLDGAVFLPRVDYAVGNTPFAITTTDRDGDELVDLVVTNFGASSISVLKGNGDGTFAQNPPIEVGSNPHCVVAADVNSDGSPDLVVANSQSASIAVLLNDGSGAFSTRNDYTVGLVPYSAAVSDLDGDDDMDIVVANADANSVSVLYNQGSGNFGNRADLGTGFHPESVCLIDIDLDGWDDIVTANYISNDIYVLRNDGSGNFSFYAAHSVGANPVFVSSGDLNGNLIPDILVTNRGSNSVSVFLRSGDGSFVDSLSFPAGNEPYAVSQGEFDSNAGVDLAVANWADNTVSLHIGSGSGTFGSPNFYPTGIAPYSICAADFNRDGKIDLATANHLSNSVSVLINQARLPRLIRVPSEQLTIQAGINAAIDGDTVLVAPGVYAETFSYNGKSICVKGEKGADSTVLSYPTVISTLISFAGSEDTLSILEGVTIQEVVHEGPNIGLIDVNGASATIRQCKFMDNTDSGAGIGAESIIRMISGGFLVVEDCLFQNNTAFGAAGVGISGGSGRITRNRFIGNRAWRTYGGAIGLGWTTWISISENLFLGNESTGIEGVGFACGGAIFLSSCGGVNIANNTFVANRAENGGAIYFWYCSENYVVQNVFVGNTGSSIAGNPPTLFANLCFQNTPGDYGVGLSPDSCSINADPLICDTAIGGFDLHPYSLCWPSNNSCGLMIGAPADTCWPTIRNVPGDCATIQNGIDAALPGDTVLVAPGSYYENIDFRGKSIVVASNFVLSRDTTDILTTVIDGQRLGPTVTFSASGDTTTALVGFSIRNGIGLAASSGNFYGGGVAILQGASAAPRISYNYIHQNSSGTGTSGAGAGIGILGQLGASSPTDLPRVKIAKNKIFDNTSAAAGAAIYVESRSDVVVTDNIIYSNRFRSGGGGAVQFFRVKRGLIVNNTITLHPFSAIKVYSEMELQLRNNLIAYNGDSATELNGLYYATGSTENLHIDHNCFYGDGQDFNFIMPGLQDTTFYNVNGTICDSFFNIYAVPQFIDTGAADFNLSANSPCIDAGDPDPVYFDVDGTIGDIGALPYHHRILVQSLSVASENQQHVVSHTPTLLWSHGPSGEVTQDSAKIEITTDSAWLFVDTWESGAIATADTLMQYDGATALLDGEAYFIRIRLHGAAAWSPWYYASFGMNSVPTAPILRAPTNLAVVGSTPILWVTNGADAESDPLTYEFAGFHDTDCVSGPDINLIGVASGVDSTGGQIVDPLAENCRYWWMARTFDGYEYSPWTAYAQFLVNGTPEAPAAPTLDYPPLSDNKPIFTLLPTLDWQISHDPDPGDTVRYKLELSDRANFSFGMVRDSLINTNFPLTDSLEFGRHYYWRVTARDVGGLSAMSGVKEFWTWKLGDLNHSHSTDLSDLSLLIGYLTQTPRPNISPKMVADLTGDCKIDLSDLSVMVAFMTTSGVQLHVGCE